MKHIHKIYRLVACCFALIFATCSSQVSDPDGHEKVYLNLSEEIVNFARVESQTIVNVKTNATSWVATSPAEGKWLTIKKSGEDLIISASANETGQERSGYVLINAGEASAVLTINQSIGSATLELSETNLSVISNGGKYTLMVKSNGAEWTIEGSEMYPWLNVEKVDGTQFMVTVNPNTAEESREGKFYVRTNESTYEIIVSQRGLPIFLLPYMLEHGKSRTDLMQFEEARGTKFIGSSNEKGQWTYSFLGNDKFASSIAYVYPFGTQIYGSCVITSPNTQFGIDPVFESYLFSLGFTKDILKKETFEKGIHTKHYILQKQSIQLNATVQVSITANWTEVVYTATEGQGTSYPTFEELPLRNTTFFNKNNYFEVKKWEETEGNSIEAFRQYGSKNPNVIYFAEYAPISQEKSSRLVTIYFFEQEKADFMGLVSQKTDFFTNISAAMWQDTKGTYNITSEFKDLAIRAGFEYQGVDPAFGSVNFARYQDGLVMIVKVYPKYEHYNNAQPVLGLAYYQLDVSISAKMKHSGFMERKAYFSALAEKMDKNYQMWFKTRVKK